MVKIGSTILYGSQVCRVTDIRDCAFGKTVKNYYVLTPAFDEKNVIYVPSDNEALLAKMRKILSADEIRAIIKNLPEKSTVWIEDDKLRATEYKRIIDSGDREQIMIMIKTLFEKGQEKSASGKKLHALDEALLARAEKMIYEEFSLVLNIKKEDVIPFIAEQIEI